MTLPLTFASPAPQSQQQGFVAAMALDDHGPALMGVLGIAEEVRIESAYDHVGGIGGG